MITAQRRERWILIGLLAASMLLYSWQGWLPRNDFFPLLASWGALLLLAVLLFRHLQHRSEKWWWYTGMLLRMAVLWYAPQLSDDYLRYLFDGQLTSMGINPFAALPVDNLNATTLTAEQELLLRSKNYYAVYPPLPQGLFALSWWLGQTLLPAVIILKIGWLIIEGITLFYLPKTLKRYGIPPVRSLLYTLHPLVIIELIGNAHLEVGMVLGMVLTLHALASNRPFFAGIGIGLAVAFKLLPLLFAYPLIRQHKSATVQSILALGGVIAIPIIAFQPVSTLANLLTSLKLYVIHFAFNGGLYNLLTAITNLPGDTIGTAFAALFFLSWITLTYLYHKAHLTTPAYWLLVLTVYYLFATTVNPWYIVPIILLTPFNRWVFPWVWGLSILLSYSAFSNVSMQVPLWALVTEYGSLALAILFDIYKHVKPSPMASTTACED